jgi:hypothetical protein
MEMGLEPPLELEVELALLNSAGTHAFFRAASSRGLGECARLPPANMRKVNALPSHSRVQSLWLQTLKSVPLVSDFL